MGREADPRADPLDRSLDPAPLPEQVLGVGGDLVTAAVSHLAASTPPDTLFTASFMNDWVNEHVAGYEPRSQAGFGSAPARPGLGVDVDLAALGAPLFSVGA